MSPIILFLLAFNVALVQCGWRQMPGAAKQISAKGAGLWIVGLHNHVSYWNGKAWVATRMHANHVAAQPNGYAANAVLWFRNPGHMFWIDTRNGNLDWKNGDSDVYLQNINCNGPFLIGAEWWGGVRRWDSSGWKPQEYNNPAAQIAIGVDNELWKVDHNSNLFRWSTNNWQQMPGSGVYVDVQNANRVVMTDHNGNAYLWGVDNKDWIQLDGAECVQATINEKSVYCVSSKGGIFEWQPSQD